MAIVSSSATLFASNVVTVNVHSANAQGAGAEEQPKAAIRRSLLDARDGVNKRLCDLV